MDMVEQGQGPKSTGSGPRGLIQHDHMQPSQELHGSSDLLEGMPGTEGASVGQG